MPDGSTTCMPRSLEPCQVSRGSCCRGSRTYELIAPDSTLDPLETSPSGVRCKRTSISHLVVKLDSLYRCRLVRRTPYTCSPALDGSVLIVAVRECIIAFRSISAPTPLLGVGASSVLCCCLEAEYPILPLGCAGSGGFLPGWAGSRKKS